MALGYTPVVKKYKQSRKPQCQKMLTNCWGWTRSSSSISACNGNLDKQSAFACDLLFLYPISHWYADKKMAHLCICATTMDGTAD